MSIEVRHENRARNKAFEKQIRRVARDARPWHERFDDTMSVAVKIWLYLLELAGIAYTFVLMIQFDVGLRMIRNEVPGGREYIDAVKVAAESTYTIVAGICVAIPALIAVLKTGRKVAEIYRTPKPSNGIVEHVPDGTEPTAPLGIDD